MMGQFETDNRVSSDGVSMRRCTTCGMWKPLYESYAKNGELQGVVQYRLECKVCYNVKRKENNNKKKHSDFVGGMRRRGEEGVQYSHQEWKEAVIFFGGECAYCGATPKRGRVLTKDHLVAVSEGGATTADNIVPACDSCNSSKGNREWHDWYMAQEFFSQNRMNQIFRWRSIQRIVKEPETETETEAEVVATDE